METNKLARLIALLGVLGALGIARDARAQAGDLDILSRSVPPVVMIQFDTSGSMRQIVLPENYRTDRGASNPSVWFNRPNTDATNRPAAFRDVSTSPLNWEDSGTGTGTSTESYERTCQIFPNATNNGQSQAVCAPGSTSCADDDDFGNQLESGHVIKCWNVPGGCANVPSDFTCSTATRVRRREGSVTTTSQPYTTITTPDLSFTSTTLYSPNYLWWMVNEIYKGTVPVPFIAQDRLAAAKQAVTTLMNAMNVDFQPPKVKFGLARYEGNTNNGGFVVVPADINSKAAILVKLTNNPSDPNGLDANGSTPLSETLVDVGRYLAGADRLKSTSGLTSYPAYSRDLQGREPNAAGFSGTPATPVTSSCEKLFVIVVTDGLPTSDSNNHYGTNFTTVMSGFIDGDGDYLDDVAKKLYATDLRPTLSGNQNVITYTVGFSVDSPLLQDAAVEGHGLYFSANDADDLAGSLIGAINDILARNTSFTAATVPASRSAFGNGFYTAYFVPTGRKSAWPGRIEAYTFDPSLVVLDDANQPAIDPITKVFKEPRNPHWDVHDTLIADYASRSLYTNKSGARADFTPAGITAVDLGVTLPELAQYPLDPNLPALPDADALADAIVSWVHGYDSFDEDGDGSLVDARPWVLGDVFHSNPVAIGPPLPFLRFETGYGPASTSTSFMATFRQRERMLYVGANDGVLHAIEAGSFVDPNTAVVGDESYDAGTGHELFGFVPGTLLPKIKLLPKDDIAKQYYVDGSPSAADVWIDYDSDGLKEGSDWTTVLLAPLREGGESLLALDVTDPQATSGYHGPSPRFMWEFTHAGLGQTWSRPIVTRVKIRGTIGLGDTCGANDGDGDCYEEWVAIFGAGYRPEGNPNMSVYTNDPNSGTYTTKGRGVYVVKIKDGSILARLTQDPNSPTLSKMKYAIPAEPAVLDLNFDGFADAVYIGDLGGQLWKWDLSRVGVPVAGVVPTTVWPAGILFEAPVATVGGGIQHYHSIFQSAAAAYSEGVLMLSFASGERTDLGYQGVADPNDPNGMVGLHDDNNRFWVVADRRPTGTGAFPTTLPIYEEPLFPATVPLAGHGTVNDVTGIPTDPNTADEGYFFRVPDGEKFITNHLIFAGKVATVSYMPDVAGSGVGGNCALGGTTQEWAWDLADGTASLDDPVNVNQFVRKRSLGNGAPTDPRITVSKDSNGAIVVKISTQTSMGEIQNPDGGGLSLDPVDMIYWRQNF